MDIDSLIDQLARNEALAHKFHELESRILSILNFRDFFEILLTSVGSMFDIPHVWLTFIDGTPMAESIRSMDDSQLLSRSTSSMSLETFAAITGSSTKPLLANTGLDRFIPLFPTDAPHDIGSLAITPIVLEGAILGSLNQADADTSRFEPGMNTDLLERLALKISLCLMNVSAHEQLRFLAYHDTLTGLLNRRVMESILEREFERAHRYASDLTVIFIDLDRFKQINDTHGHDHGDAALIHVANALEELRRNSDVVARFAGDEFVVILPSTDPVKAQSFTDRIVEYLHSNPMIINGLEIFISLSSGIASTRDKAATTPSALLKLSDERLYQAKQNRP
ncbi:MAG: sensor domain-containing diguanylate cyclase [Pseudomonadota bacterium]